ncbi:MAG TPA: hypothetical protein VIL89_09605 [Clostridia bacterium]
MGVDRSIPKEKWFIKLSPIGQILFKVVYFYSQNQSGSWYTNDAQVEGSRETWYNQRRNNLFER